MDDFFRFSTKKNWVFGYSRSTLLWYRCYYPHRSRDALSPVCGIFKASALWADAFQKSICPSVCLFVRLSVCPSVCSLLPVFLLPLPEIGCPIFLEIWNPWGKVMERSGLRFEHFWFVSSLKSLCKKKFFLWLFSLTKHGGNHASRWIRDLWSKGISLILAYL